MGDAKPEVVDALTAAIDDAVICKDAMEALAYMGVAAKPALARLIRALDEKLYPKLAAQALGGIGREAADAVPALHSALRVRDMGVLTAVAKALGSIGA